MWLCERIGEHLIGFGSKRVWYRSKCSALDAGEVSRSFCKGESCRSLTGNVFRVYQPSPKTSNTFSEHSDLTQDITSVVHCWIESSLVAFLSQSKAQRFHPFDEDDENVVGSLSVELLEWTRAALTTMQSDNSTVNVLAGLIRKNNRRHIKMSRNK